MKNLKFVLAITALAALVSCGSISNADLSGNTAGTSAAGQPVVELINAKTMINKNGGLSGPWETKLAGDIELENIAYTKTVQIVYSVNGGAWENLNASYVKSLGNNREHWKFSGVVNSYSQGGDPRTGYMGPENTIQFAVKYVVNGQEYWDNNGGIGIDYRVTTTEGSGDQPYAPTVLAKQDLVLKYATYSGYPTTYFRGNIAVKKINGETGTVTVVFTTDGWNTTQTLATSTYGDGFADQKIYNFNGSYYGDVDIEFALVHDINGQSLWDNNIGGNYVVGFGVSAPY